MNKSPRKFLRLCAHAALLLAIAGLVLVIGRGVFKVDPPLSAMAAGPGPIQKGESEGEWSERDAYWAGRRGLQFGVPQTAYRAAAAQMSRMEAAFAAQLRSRAFTGAPAIPFSWDFIGPLPIFNNLPNFGGVLFTGAPLANSQGRVSAVAADPTTPGRLFVGTAGGGVWMTTDGGNSFTPIFDGQPSLAIGAIALYPKTTPPTIFVGTGEGNGGDSYYGQGIFKSEDLGASWTPLAPGTFDRVAFTRLAVDSNNPPHLFAAVTGADSLNRADALFVETNPANGGLWRSLDGGNTWTQYPVATFDCAVGSNPCPADDVVIDPNNPKNVFAAIDNDNVFRSSDGGDTWQGMTFPGVPAGLNQMGRQSLAVSVSSPGTVYAMLGAPSGTNYVGFFKSSDSGAHWTAATVPSETLALTRSLDGSGAGYSQSNYDQALAVIPDNAAKLYFGGVGPYISTNSGAGWTFIAGGVFGTAPSTHADQHAVAVDPFNTNILYIGDDGGFYSYDLSTGTGVWTALSFGFSAGQIQGIGPHPWDNAKLIAGFQDNGTQIYSGSQGWPVSGGTELFGLFGEIETGDGGFALFDQIDPDYAYHTFATDENGPTLSTSSDGGGTWNSVTPTDAIQAAIKAAGDPGAIFYPPLAADPAIPQRVVVGAHGVYVSTDGMNSWQPQTSQFLGGVLSDLEIVGGNHSYAWSLSEQNPKTVPATPFKVFNTAQVSLNHGAVWNDVTANLPFDSAKTQGSSIAPNPNNINDAYLGVSGFSAVTGIGHVFRTTDFGTSWARRDGAGELRHCRTCRS